MTDATSEVPVTEEEKEQILRHALGLIREPQSWTMGSWKCPMPEINLDLTMKINPKTGQYVQATDDNGRPLFQYCVHGALNQATYDILGEERAIELGAINPLEENDSRFNGSESQYGLPAFWIGVESLAYEEYGHEAMEFNDGAANCEPEDEEVARETRHQQVLGLLRTRLSQLTGRAA